MLIASRSARVQTVSLRAVRLGSRPNEGRIGGGSFLPLDTAWCPPL